MFVGRESERAALASLAAQAAGGDGSIVLVAGEAGVGKSMLVRTVLADCGLERYEGFGVQDGASAYGPIVEALRSILQRRAIAPPMRAQLAVIVPELGPPVAEVEQATVFEAIRSTLALAASQRPLVLVLDDLQWADGATLDLLPALARSLEAEPVLLLGVIWGTGPYQRITETIDDIHERVVERLAPCCSLPTTRRRRASSPA
jgi:predicted ATPase